MRCQDFFQLYWQQQDQIFLKVLYVSICHNAGLFSLWRTHVGYFRIWLLVRSANRERQQLPAQHKAFTEPLFHFPAVCGDRTRYIKPKHILLELYFWSTSTAMSVSLDLYSWMDCHEMWPQICHPCCDYQTQLWYLLSCRWGKWDVFSRVPDYRR